MWNPAYYGSQPKHTDRLSFGLTQAIGDHEPKHPALSRVPHCSVTADNGSYQNRTAASVAQIHRGCASLKTGQEMMQCNEQQCRFVYWLKELNQHLPALRAGLCMAILQALSQATCTQYDQFLKKQTWMSRSQKKYG